MTSHRRRLIATVLGLTVLATACGSGEGGQTRGEGNESGSGSGSGSLADQDLSAGTDDPLVLQAVADYERYVAGQVGELVPLTRTLTDAVRAGDLPAAQAAYAPSREPWERIEPIAGLIEEIDGKVDARVDDYASVDDPDFTGWHRLEYLLFEQQTTQGAAPFADRLDTDLATLQTELAMLEIPPPAVAIGAAELIEEVSEGKITGEEDRYSKTDLWDFGGNVEGAQAVIGVLTPALQQADPGLLADIEAGFSDLNSSLDPLRAGEGWVLYCRQDDEFPSPRCPGVTVERATVDRLKAQLAGLSEDLALVAGALGLR
ncbi:MAG: EfeM/EfeO family lipoprotein [Actinomycetota bacterium]|nr:EfeM/EfeO family lipoprotein [Actinomycetota bacterium]